MSEQEENKEWKDPSKEMMESPEFNAVWNLIKYWDINVPEIDGEGVYKGATGNHVRAILDAIKSSRPNTVRQIITKLKYEHLGNKTKEELVKKLDKMLENTVI